MKLPPVPPCHGQFGAIQCAPGCSLACAAARGLYAHAQSIADLPGDAARKDAVNDVRRTLGIQTAERLRAAAKHLLSLAATPPAQQSLIAA